MVRAIKEGNLRTTWCSASNVEHNAIKGHFEHFDIGFLPGQQSIWPGMFMLAAAVTGACDGLANAAGPSIRPANMLIATTNRMSMFEVITQSLAQTLNIGNCGRIEKASPQMSVVSGRSAKATLTKAWFEKGVAYRERPARA